MLKPVACSTRRAICCQRVTIGVAKRVQLLGKQQTTAPQARLLLSGLLRIEPGPAGAWTSLPLQPDTNPESLVAAEHGYREAEDEASGGGSMRHGHQEHGSWGMH